MTVICVVVMCMLTKACLPKYHYLHRAALQSFRSL